MAAGNVPWWSWVGAASISVMFVFVSIPLLEKRSRARRAGFDAHTKRVSMLVPWFRRAER